MSKNVNNDVSMNPPICEKCIYKQPSYMRMRNPSYFADLLQPIIIIPKYTLWV